MAPLRLRRRPGCRGFRANHLQSTAPMRSVRSWCVSSPSGPSSKAPPRPCALLHTSTASECGARRTSPPGRCGVDPLSGVRIHVPLFVCLAADPYSSRSYRMVCMSSCCCSSTQSSLRTWTHSVVTGSGPGRSRLATARAGSPRGQRSVAAGMSVATRRMVAVGPSATVRATVVTGSGPGISRPTGQPLPQDSDIPHRPHRHG